MAGLGPHFLLASSRKRWYLWLQRSLIFQSSRKDNDLLFVEWRERKIKADPSYLLFLCILH